MQDKRAHLRKALQTQAWLGNGKQSAWQPIDLLDISVGGAAFIVQDELPAGSQHTFHFYLPNHPARISMTAQVMHCLTHTYLKGYRTGVKISHIDAEALALIAQFVAAAPPQDAA